MLNRFVQSLPIAFLSLALSAPRNSIAQDTSQPLLPGDGVVKVKSAYPIAETITRLKKDVADKGIRFFLEVDQSRLAADAGITIRPSTLLVFGNAPLGTLFMKAAGGTRLAG